MIKSFWRSPLVTVALAAAMTWCGYWLFGPVGLLILVPVVVHLLTLLIIRLGSAGYRTTKTIALAPLQGVNYSFRGIPIPIWEDDEDQRWISTAAVRRVLPLFPRDAVLARVFASGLLQPTRRVGLAVRVDELLNYLARSELADAVQFKNWVRREIYFPSGSARRAGNTPISSIVTKPLPVQNEEESCVIPGGVKSG